MPELPEVNRVTNILKRAALGKTVESVTTTEDSIIFCDGITNVDFAAEMKGRTIVDVGRRGKVFYLMLSGEGRHPVMHLGMTGNVYVRGTDPSFYKSMPQKLDTSWPPRFMKFILTLSPSPSPPSTDPKPIEIVFVDPRRLARIRLLSSPLTSPPISNLGFDPILSMPSLSSFLPSVKRRQCTIKSLLLDQSFSAGIGNWVADEVLFHAGIHPEQKPNLLDEAKITLLHEKIKYVCETAVSVDADAAQFPEGWLFKHRWGKGKKRNSDLILSSGEKAVIKWITVGSRTSAFVPSVQRLYKTESKTAHNDGDSGSESELTELSEPEGDVVEEPSPPVKVIRVVKRKTTAGVTADRVEVESEVEVESNPLAGKNKRLKTLKREPEAEVSVTPVHVVNTIPIRRSSRFFSAQ